MPVSLASVLLIVCITLAALVVVLSGVVIHQARQLTRDRHLRDDASRLENEFLSTASHELRTPLNAIAGWVQVLQSGALPEGERQHAIDAIARNAKTQARVIQGLLDAPRIPPVATTVDTPPIARPPDADVRRPRSSGLSGVRVLLAEDDPDSAAALTAILNLRGCEARTGGTAAECLRIIKEWPADVLLCDVGLPDDDGYGLLRRMRLLPQGSHLPAIALTAMTRDEDRARALAAGFRSHVAKPFEVERLMNEISSAVGSTTTH
ncbi:MAG: response regulator [Vicinamibacterales bacterium]